MTKKITVSLPDDVAERLALEDNVSAFVAESIRRRTLGERVREQLRQQGYEFSDEELEASERKHQLARAQITPELRQKAHDLLANIKSQWA